MIKKTVAVSSWMPVPTDPGTIKFVSSTKMRKKVFLVLQSNVTFNVLNVHKPQEIDLIVWCTEFGPGRLRSNCVERVA